MQRLCSITALILFTLFCASAQAPAPTVRSSGEIERKVDSYP